MACYEKLFILGKQLFLLTTALNTCTSEHLFRPFLLTDKDFIHCDICLPPRSLIERFSFECQKLMKQLLWFWFYYGLRLSEQSNWYVNGLGLVSRHSFEKRSKSKLVLLPFRSDTRGTRPRA